MEEDSSPNINVNTGDNNELPANTSVDKLAARREARRRKILENSSNRLSKIVGHEMPAVPKADTDETATNTDSLSSDTLPADNETTPDPSYIVYPDPQDERMEYVNTHVEALLANSGFTDDSFMNAMNGGNVASGGQNSDVFQLLNTLNQVQSNGGMFASNRNVGSSQTSQPTSRSNSRFARLLRSKIHLVIASVVTYLLFATGNESYVGGNVFLPLLAWEMLELLTIGASEPAGAQQLLGMVFLLGGIPMKTSQTIMKLISTVNKVLKDVAFFMFFFVVTHLLWSRLWLGIELRYVLGYDQLDPTVDTATVVLTQ
ncbi:uncharacterized protein LOC128723955 [Anopheles nili]|uniref:uncharacterized protein LOC128723955 n=1 Tax=Anopheles nili TaxID=185578 RepID=UPI00237A205D|nr:uncharacterized protein LOC128723955 [Anopheles nili]